MVFNSIVEQLHSRVASTMSKASKVGEIFLAAGNAYSALGEAIMALHPAAGNTATEAPANSSGGHNNYNNTNSSVHNSSESPDKLMADVNQMLNSDS